MRAFLSIVLVLAFLPLLYGCLKAHADVSRGTGEISNALVLHQRANEVMYGLENGLLLTLRDSASSGMGGERAIAGACAAIDAWASTRDAELKVGFVDANTYRFSETLTTAFGIAQDVKAVATREWLELLGGLSPTACMNFLEASGGIIRVKDRALIDFSLLGYEPNFMPGYRAAFAFTAQVHGARLTTLIPEGVVVDAGAGNA